MTYASSLMIFMNHKVNMAVDCLRNRNNHPG